MRKKTKPEDVLRVAGEFPVLIQDGSVRIVTLEQIIEHGDRVFGPDPEPVTAEQIRHFLSEDFREGLIEMDGRGLWRAAGKSWLASTLLDNPKN